MPVKVDNPSWTVVTSEAKNYFLRVSAEHLKAVGSGRQLFELKYFSTLEDGVNLCTPFKLVVDTTSIKRNQSKNIL